MHRITALLGNVRRLALRKGAEREALERVDRAPVLDVEERARALHCVGVVVQVGVNPWRRCVRHAARLARDGRVVRVADRHEVALRQLLAPLVDLLLAHQELAVIPAKGW